MKKTIMGLVLMSSVSAIAGTTEIGKIEKVKGEPLILSFNEAVKYCHQKGTRLPTLQELHQADVSGKLSSEAELKNYHYWTSTEAPRNLIDETKVEEIIGFADNHLTNITIPVVSDKKEIQPVFVYEFGSPYLSVEWSHHNSNPWTVVRCIN